VQWGSVKSGDVFITRNHGLVAKGRDVWLVLEISQSLVIEHFVQIRYIYLHDMSFDSISTFSVDPVDSVDYEPLFEMTPTCV